MWIILQNIYLILFNKLPKEFIFFPFYCHFITCINYLHQLALENDEPILANQNTPLPCLNTLYRCNVLRCTVSVVNRKLDTGLLDRLGPFGRCFVSKVPNRFLKKKKLGQMDLNTSGFIYFSTKLNKHSNNYSYISIRM